MDRKWQCLRQIFNLFCISVYEGESKSKVNLSVEAL